MSKEALLTVGATDAAALAASARGLDFGKLIAIYEIVSRYSPDLLPMLNEIVALGKDGIDLADVPAFFAVLYRYGPEAAAFFGELFKLFVAGKEAA